MLILLPPSEGKVAPGRGKPVDLDSLAFAAELGERRARLLDGLERLGGQSVKRAVKALGVSAGQAGEVAIDAALRRAPAAAAAEVYSGVLYERLELPGLPAAPRRRAAKQVLIASALWGFVRPQDRIPYYRFSAKARLKGIGPPAAWWRQALTAAMPDEPGELVVDMRSAAYAAAWKPKSATLLSVRAFSESAGKRKPVSHMAKAVRGEVARALLLSEAKPADPETAAGVVAAAGFEVELTNSTLDVILPG
jgi:cytoplasmic iron level regulating protein YaaA (DUF328/UPF0246 family)